jgi:hypothetical protein
VSGAAVAGAVRSRRVRVARKLVDLILKRAIG